MIKALIKLDYSLSEIDDNLKLNNWRNPSSIWGELSRLIFRRNISKYRGKIRHLWYNNRCNVQNRFKTAVLQHKTSLTNVNTQNSNLNSQIPTNLKETGYSDVNEIIGSKTASFSNIYSQIVPAKTFHASTTCILKENPCEIECNASKFHLSYQEWSQVEPQFANVKLQPEWTNIFTRKIEEFFPLCVLVFKCHRINVKYESRKCYFLIAEANCKFTNCITLKFWIDRAPENWVDKLPSNRFNIFSTFR